MDWYWSKACQEPSHTDGGAQRASDQSLICLHFSSLTLSPESLLHYCLKYTHSPPLPSLAVEKLSSMNLVPGAIKVGYCCDNAHCCCCCCCVASVVSDSVWPHRRQPTRLPRPWDSPGKNTGVGCHFLLQCMKVKSESEALSRVQLLATPWTAAYQAPPSIGFSRQEYWSGVPLPSLDNAHSNDKIVMRDLSSPRFISNKFLFDSDYLHLFFTLPSSWSVLADHIIESQYILKLSNTYSNDLSIALNISWV